MTTEFEKVMVETALLTEKSAAQPSLHALSYLSGLRARMMQSIAAKQTLLW